MSSLEFENELYEMTEAAEKVLLDDDELPYYLNSDVYFEEVPYGNYRTDIVTVSIDAYALGRREDALGHVTPLPDSRMYRNSYRQLQNAEPISRYDWIHENSTYAEQTARTAWDWLEEHDYLRVCSLSELGHKDVERHHYVTVKFPDICTICAWELKPRDWERALHQVKRAEEYAEYRMVLLDAGAIDDALVHDSEFREENVGLASLGRDGFELHVYPSKRPTLRTTTRQLLNERAMIEIGEERLHEKLNERR